MRILASHLLTFTLLCLAACGDDSGSQNVVATAVGGSAGAEQPGTGGPGSPGGNAGTAGEATSGGAAGSAGTGGGAGSTSTGGAAGAAGSVAPAGLAIVGDTDRDGDIDSDDLADRSAWSWKRGAFFIANLDDDDDDGESDAADDVVNGAPDADDLAPIELQMGTALAASAKGLRLTLLEGAAHVRLFHGNAPITEPLAPAESVVVTIEAKRFAGPDWDGVVRVRVEALDDQAASIAQDELELRVAPWIMLPSSAVPTAIHVAKGAYSNQPFLDDLSAAASKAGVTLLAPYSTTHWQEMWMQDTMEIGYTQIPGRAPTHVALRAPRGQDSYPKTLLGPGLGYLEVGAPRSTPGGDAWVDWFGNLEVSPAVPGWPLGRIYYGHDTTTGMKLHPDVVAFLEAQQVQSPFWIDTSWLTIKHVDEILTFVPASDGSPRMLVASPREAGILYPDYYGDYNKGIQAKIDKSLHGGSYTVPGSTIDDVGVLKHLNLTEDAVIELPLFYTDGHNDWSNPINGLYIGGYFVAGETDIWAAERNVTQSRIEALGIEVLWVDDSAYQPNLGNVHCATNTTRAPIVPQFATAIPGAL